MFANVSDILVPQSNEMVSTFLNIFYKIIDEENTFIKYFNKYFKYFYKIF